MSEPGNDSNDRRTNVGSSGFDEPSATSAGHGVRTPSRLAGLPGFKMHAAALWSQFAFDVTMLGVNSALRVPSHAWRRQFLRRVAGVDLGADVSIARGLRLTCRGNLSIGDRAIINSSVMLDARGGLRIASDVNISRHVSVWTADHDPASSVFAGRTREVSIGRRSWLASHAVILPGAVIGEGCIVAAGAVVHGTLAPYAIVAGNPAGVIGDRPRDAQLRLTRYRQFFG